MAYLGNEPDFTTYTLSVEKFSGTGACTQFTLAKNVSDANSIMVVVNGVYQYPTYAYNVTNGVLTFTEAPDNSYANNISITYLVYGVVTYETLGPGQIQAGAVTETSLGTGAVTTTKIADSAVTGNKIAANTIRGNNIVAGQITGNLIGTGSISANHYAGGGVTSNVLSSNLQISVSRVAETINVNLGATPAGNYNIECANSTVYYFTQNTSGNLTFNLVANTGPDFPTNGLNGLVNIGQSVSVTIFLKQGAIKYRANVFVDGARANGIIWLGNAQPQYQETQQQSIDVYSISAIKLAQNTWTVFASNSNYGYANGQGMGALNGSVY